MGIDHLHPRIVRHKVYPNGAEIGRDQQRSPGDSRRVVNRRRPDDRGVRPLAYATPEFARELKIPNMEKPGQFLWPQGAVPAHAGHALLTVSTSSFARISLQARCQYAALVSCPHARHVTALHRESLHITDREMRGTLRSQEGLARQHLL